jgi:ABC-type antimicrobial peptide transport system permease subunit
MPALAIGANCQDIKSLIQKEILVLEFIGGIVVLILGWAVTMAVLSRIFPEWGLKRAERRYMENPTAVNENLMWKARSRANRRDASTNSEE